MGAALVTTRQTRHARGSRVSARFLPTTKTRVSRVRPYDPHNPGKTVPAALWSNKRLWSRLQLEADECRENDMKLYLVESAVMNNIEVRIHDSGEAIFLSVVVAKDGKLMFAIQASNESQVFHDHSANG